MSPVFVKKIDFHVSKNAQLQSLLPFHFVKNMFVKSLHGDPTWFSCWNPLIWVDFMWPNFLVFQNVLQTHPCINSPDGQEQEGGGQVRSRRNFLGRSPFQHWGSHRKVFRWNRLTWSPFWLGRMMHFFWDMYDNWWEMMRNIWWIDNDLLKLELRWLHYVQFLVSLGEYQHQSTGLWSQVKSFKRLRATAGQGPNYVGPLCGYIGLCWRMLADLAGNVGPSCGYVGLCWPHVDPCWAKRSEKWEQQKNTVKRRIFWWSAAYLGAMLAHLAAMLPHLGAMLAHLGAMLAHLGAMLAHLGAMLAHIGAMLAHLETYVGPSGGLCWPILAHLEPQDPKNGQKWEEHKTP